MSKWFFLQFLLVTLFAAFLGHGSLLPRYLDIWSPYMQKIELHRGEGVIWMLADEFNAVSSDQHRKLLEELQAGFGYKISVQTLADLELTAKQLAELKSGRTQFDRSNLRLIKAINAVDQSIVIENMEEPSEQFDSPFEININGTLEILIQTLLDRPQASWKKLLEKMTGQHQLPLGIVKKGSLSLAPATQQQLNAQGVAYIQSLDSSANSLPGNIIYRQLGNSGYILKVGPLMPKILSTTQTLRIISTIYIALLVLVPLLLWIYPTWRSAKSLQKASQHFALNDLNIRASVYFASHLNNLAKMFNQLADRICFLDTRNKLLTSAVSHDLRTPISAMEFSLALMQNSTSVIDRRRHLNNLSQYLDTLNVLSAQLQTYAKFDRHEVLLVKQKIVIAHWLKQHTVTVEKAHNIQLNIDQQLSSLVVSFDPDYLARVIDNLLSNNLRHAHSLVVVSMQLTAGHKQLQIIIENDGAAIEQENRQNIFEPFVRLDENRTDNSEGSGLGLAIVRQIIHWHKGEVSAAQSHLGGAKFIITLPIE